MKNEEKRERMEQKIKEMGRKRTEKKQTEEVKRKWTKKREAV